MTIYRTTALDNIVPKKQVRTTFRAIAELADNIADHGLLQNLVVSGDKPPYPLQAGERRYRALQMLREQKRLPRGWTGWEDVPVCVAEDDPHQWAQLSENILREDLLPWELGRKFLEHHDAGLREPDIAKHIGRTVGFVSMHCVIARGLHAITIERILGVGRDAFTVSTLHRIARLQTIDGSPDRHAQKHELDRELGLLIDGKRVKRKRGNVEELKRRIDKLETTPIPLEYKKVVKHIVDYLQGRINRLTLRRLREAE